MSLLGYLMLAAYPGHMGEEKVVRCLLYVDASKKPMIQPWCCFLVFVSSHLLSICLLGFCVVHHHFAAVIA